MDELFALLDRQSEKVVELQTRLTAIPPLVPRTAAREKRKSRIPARLPEIHGHQGHPRIPSSRRRRTVRLPPEHRGRDSRKGHRQNLVGHFPPRRSASGRPRALEQRSLHPGPRWGHACWARGRGQSARHRVVAVGRATHCWTRTSPLKSTTA